jgi:hypothetical protein
VARLLIRHGSERGRAGRVDPWFNSRMARRTATCRGSSHMAGGPAGQAELGVGTASASCGLWASPVGPTPTPLLWSTVYSWEGEGWMGLGGLLSYLAIFPSF